MRIVPHIPLLALASVLTLGSCTETEVEHIYHVDPADNAILLGVGVLSSPASTTPATRAADPALVALTAGTQLRLHVEGEWHHAGGSTDITKEPIYKAGAPTSTGNPLSHVTGDVLYWDDFGTADPDNMETGGGREKGLAIYAFGVEGLTTFNTEWPAEGNLTWDLDTENNNVSSGDLIVSNNLTGEAVENKTGADPSGRYTYDQQKNSQSGKLIFKHVLSKITFVVKAGKGFADGKFTAAPTVELVQYDSNNKTTLTEYCLTKGTVDVKKAQVNAGAEKEKVTAQIIDDSDLSEVTEAAIVYPGTELGSSEANKNYLARINADGNIYYISASAIRTVIEENDAHKDESNNVAYKTLPGYNYQINVTINKTGVEMTATLTDWNKLEATVETPKINVGASGGTGTALAKDFSLYLSFVTQSPKDTYSYGAFGTLDTDKYKANGEATYADSKFTLNPPLYWPTHNTHYLFRGVYPSINATKGPTVTTDGTTPVVGTHQFIVVTEQKYEEGKFPGDLMIGVPSVPSNVEEKACGNNELGHTKVDDMSVGGICAREGNINLHFSYMMARVEVHLYSESSDANEKVMIDSNTKLELFNICTDGKVYLIGYSNSNDTTPEAKAEEPTGTSTWTLAQCTEAGAKTNEYGCEYAVVPQKLTDDLKFKVTVKNSDNSTDAYEATVNLIPVKVQGSSDTPAPIAAWESGKHYIYKLNVLKTKIAVTATLEEWDDKEGYGSIWF